MQITFNHQGKNIVIAAVSPSDVKLYSVPTGYSEDGYFAALWAAGDLEPAPACAVEKATLLAHVKLGEQEGSPARAQTIYCKQGVSYAAH
jgi:hypothetical protein